DDSCPNRLVLDRARSKRAFLGDRNTSHTLPAPFTRDPIKRLSVGRAARAARSCQRVVSVVMVYSAIADRCLSRLVENKPYDLRALQVHTALFDFRDGRSSDRGDQQNTVDLRKERNHIVTR